MAGPIVTEFYDQLTGLIDQTEYRARLDRLWLGGTAGPDGGQGVRPGGYIGQLIQTLVAYDTTEAETMIGSGSLLDNLNHIRYRISALSGYINSGVLTVMEIDGIPILSGIHTLIFSGASVSAGDLGEAIVSISGISIAEQDGLPDIHGVFRIIFEGATVTDDGNSQVTVSIAGDKDIEITDSSKGLILTAPDLTRWRVTIDNSGNLVTTSI